MKKFSTDSIMGVWFIAIFLVLAIGLGIQWYHLLIDDTAKQYSHDTCIIVDTSITEVHSNGVVVEYSGMRFNIPCDVSQTDLSKSIRVKIDTQGTETNLDDTLVKAFIE